MPRRSPVNEEIARILEAEAAARGAVENARQEARSIEDEARRRASEILGQAQAACAAERERVFAERIGRADEEVRRGRVDAEAEGRALAVGASQRLDAAVEAALAALLAEVQ